LELDVIESKALELLRSRIQNGTITSLSAERNSPGQNRITVKGTYRDVEGRERKFEVRFQIKDDKPQVAEWSVF
jgi:hypothetical protein